MSPFDPQPWMEKGVEQLRRYQEAEPKWHGTGAPELFYYNLMCVAHCGAAAVYAGVGAPLSAYFQWKSILPYSEQEARDHFGVEPMGQAQLIIGLLSPATLLDVLRDYVAFEQEHGRLVKKLPRYQQYRAVGGAVEADVEGGQAGGTRRRGLAHAGLRQVADDAVAGDETPPRAAPAQPDYRHRHG